MKVNFRQALTVSALAALGVIYGVLWLRMIASPSERTGADFVGFYAAARIAQTGNPGRIYNPVMQQQIEEDLVGFELAPGQVLLFNHLPYLVPVLQLVVDRDYAASFVRWMLVLLVVLAADVGLLLKSLDGPGYSRRLLLLLAAGTLLFFPIFTSLMNGQDTVFLLFGAALWLWGLSRRKDAAAGIGLSLMTIRPQVAFFLAVPFLFRRRRVWWWFLAGAAVLGFLVFVFLGPDGTRSLIQSFLISSRGEWYGLHPEEMPTLTGLVRRAFPAVGGKTVQYIGWSTYFLALAAVCLLWLRNQRIGEQQIGLAVLMAVFFTPYLHYHDLTLLLVPIFCLMRVLYSRRCRPQDLVYLPVSISFFLLLGFPWVFLRYLAVALVMIGTATFLFYPKLAGERSSPTPELKQ